MSDEQREAVNRWCKSALTSGFMGECKYPDCECAPTVMAPTPPGQEAALERLAEKLIEMETPGHGRHRHAADAIDALIKQRIAEHQFQRDSAYFAAWHAERKSV